ncbi:MAG: hypothetical protein Q7L55_08360 [Actinomycetota bacterium]|nr:hypothetical protein [Actinomycetota bacterium]
MRTRQALIPLVAAIMVISLQPAAHSFAVEAPSQLTVRIQANSAKWVSSEVSGALVVVKDAITGQVLQTGKVVGTSGDTAAIMNDPRTPLQPTPTLDAAASVTFNFAFNSPRRLFVEAYGPLVGPTPVSQTSAPIWIVPGDKQSLALTLHGLIVTVTTPAPHSALTSSGPVQVPITASVQMLCGCPISTASPWTPNRYRVRVLVTSPGIATQTIQLVYQSTDTFTGSVTLPGAGMFDLVVVADMPGTGNTGSSATSVVVVP